MNGAPTMVPSITGMPGNVLPQPMPTVTPVNPGNMPGGAPIGQGMPPQMGQPGAQPPAFIMEDQGNGTALVRKTGPNGSPGPVVKVITIPKEKPQNQQPPAPGMPMAH